MPLNSSSPSGEHSETRSAKRSSVRLGGLTWETSVLAETFLAGQLSPPDSEMFRDHLWALGFKTLKKYMTLGHMDAICAAKGRPVTWVGYDRLSLMQREEYRDEVATEVLILSGELFDRYVRKQWRPDGGASLETWFVGACFLTFRDGYLRWAKKSGRCPANSGELSIEQLSISLASTHKVGDEIEAREAVSQVYKLASPRDHALLDLLFEGHSAASAARHLGFTAKTVEGRMRQLRKRAIAAVKTGQLTPPFGILAGVDRPQHELGSVVA